METETTTPRLWRVIFHNDEITPIGFVVHVLGKAFDYSESKSLELICQIQETGSAVVGVYSKAGALARVTMVKEMASERGWDLKVVASPETTKNAND